MSPRRPWGVRRGGEYTNRSRRGRLRTAEKTPSQPLGQDRSTAFEWLTQAGTTPRLPHPRPSRALQAHSDHHSDGGVVPEVCTFTVTELHLSGVLRTSS